MPRGLARLSVSDLHAEIRRRQRSAGPLMRRRAVLAGRIARLDEEILGAEIGRVCPVALAAGGSLNGRAGRPGRPGRGRRGVGRRRPKNKMTLVQALSKALKGKTLGVAQAMAAVRRAGYRTNSSNFRTQVNIALIKGPFRRVGRGEYRAK